MPVRGTTLWQHAIVEKKIINHDRGGTKVMCAWLDCEKDAHELYKVRVQLEKRREGRVMNYAFCSEKCKQYWLDDWRRNQPR